MPLAFFRKISAERYAVVFVANGCHIGNQGFKQKREMRKTCFSLRKRILNSICFVHLYKPYLKFSVSICFLPMLKSLSSGNMTV